MSKDFLKCTPYEGVIKAIKEGGKDAEEKLKNFLSDCIGEVLESATIEGVSEYALTNGEVSISKEDSEALVKKWLLELKTLI